MWFDSAPFSRVIYPVKNNVLWGPSTCPSFCDTVPINTMLNFHKIRYISSLHKIVDPARVSWQSVSDSYTFLKCLHKFLPQFSIFRLPFGVKFDKGVVNLMQLAIGEFRKDWCSESHALLKGPKCNFVRNFHIFIFRFKNQIGTGDEQNNVSNICVFCKTLHSESHTLSTSVSGFTPVLPTFFQPIWIKLGITVLQITQCDCRDDKSRIGRTQFTGINEAAFTCARWSCMTV